MMTGPKPGLHLQHGNKNKSPREVAPNNRHASFHKCAAATAQKTVINSRKGTRRGRKRIFRLIVRHSRLSSGF